MAQVTIIHVTKSSVAIYAKPVEGKVAVNLGRSISPLDSNFANGEQTDIVININLIARM
jgi:hypothetical protein